MTNRIGKYRSHRILDVIELQNRLDKLKKQDASTWTAELSDIGFNNLQIISIIDDWNKR